MAFENRLNTRRHANLAELPIAFAKTRCHFLTAGLDARKCDVDPKTAKDAGLCTEPTETLECRANSGSDTNKFNCCGRPVFDRHWKVSSSWRFRSRPGQFQVRSSRCSHRGWPRAQACSAARFAREPPSQRESSSTKAGIMSRWAEHNGSTTRAAPGARPRLFGDIVRRFTDDQFPPTAAAGRAARHRGIGHRSLKAAR